jgi:hypothetical protein
MTMKLIQTTTLASVATAINFTSIPQTFTDLVITLATRSTGVGTPPNPIGFAFNSGSNFSYRALQGRGSTSPTSFNGTSQYGGNAPNSNDTANTFGSINIYVPNYTSAVGKSYSIESVTENNATLVYLDIVAGLWNDTSAINTVSLYIGNGLSMAIGTTASLYGITKGSSGGVTVS